MQKLEFLVKACTAEAWRRLVWRLAIFNVAIFPENDEPPEEYDINYIDGYAHYWGADKDGKFGWLKLDDVPKDEEIFKPEDTFELTPDMYPGLSGKVPTSVGRYLFNWVVVYYSVGTRLPYMAISKDPLEYGKELYKRCVETDDTDPENEDAIRPYMVGRFVGGLAELAPMTKGIAATGTVRSLSVHPDAYKVRDALLLKYKDQLDDPAIIVKIEKALDDLDTIWLSGDQSIQFYNSKKSRMRRRKLMLMYGIESSFKEAGDYTLIPISLMEADKSGTEYLVAQFNSVRSGSYSRGAETAKGGEQVRIIQMIFQNHRIVEGDCGTKLTHAVVITEENAKMYAGMNAMENGKIVNMSAAMLKERIGKIVRLRRPILCQYGHIDCCAACASAAKAEEPRAIAADISSGFSNIMDKAMSAMHGTETVVKEFVPAIHIF